MNSGPASVAGWVDFSGIASRKYMNSGPASVAGWVTSQLLQGGSI